MFFLLARRVGFYDHCVKKWPRIYLGTLMVAVVIWSFLARGGSAEEPAASQRWREELARVEAACIEAMLRSTCSVMSGPQASEAAEVVFVAGVGAVDATAYRALRASGEAMCSLVRQSCETAWGGGPCRTARSLWPQASRNVSGGP